MCVLRDPKLTSMSGAQAQLALLCCCCVALFLLSGSTVAPCTATAPRAPPLHTFAAAPRALNASHLLAAARFSAPYASSAAFSPREGLLHALALAPFPPPAALRCIAESGGLAIVGDSNARNLASLLLQQQGRSRIPVQGVPWDSQRADEAFGATCIHFRFARNAWPLLARATEDAVLGLGARVVVAHSAFWDANPDTGVTDADWLSVWQVKISRYLLWARTVLLPAAEAADAARAGPPLPPLRFFFRDANPTLWEDLDPGRQRFMTTGRMFAMNAWLKAAIAAEAAAPGGISWNLLETGPLMPLHQLRDFVDGGDGYHANDKVNELLLELVLNELCGPRVALSTLRDVAGSDAPDPWKE